TREQLAALLGREGYDVVLAADAEEALGRLDTGPDPDLILLDMLMPLFDGWHFLRRGGQAGRPAGPIPVITRTNPAWGRGEVPGCWGLLKRPIDPETLIAEVERGVR